MVRYDFGTNKNGKADSNIVKAEKGLKKKVKTNKLKN